MRNTPQNKPDYPSPNGGLIPSCALTGRMASQPTAAYECAAISSFNHRVLLLFALAFAWLVHRVDAATNVSNYLFVSGHGLTSKSGDTSTPLMTLINECKNTGPWMQFVEREYFWSELQADGPSNSNTPGAYKYGNPGIGRIIQEAKICHQNGLKMRVMLQHKFATLPAYLTYNEKYATRIGSKPHEWNIKLDFVDSLGNAVVLGFLKGLYQAVINEFKKTGNEDACDAFYGFVIQENAFGTSTYWNAARQDKWVDHLIQLNQWISEEGRLRNFAPGSTKPHRLFWQMINSPALDAERIADAIPNGGGLCGPDTYPREAAPGAAPGEPNRVALYRTYNKMRQKRGILPLSLHVYALNYWTPYVHAQKEVTYAADMTPHLGPQPIWGRDLLDSIESYSESGLGSSQDNGWAGIGIANFLGCVSPWAKKTAAEGGQGEPDNMQVNNVVWAYTTFVPDEAVYQGYEKPSAANGWNTAYTYGWNNVRDWMKDSTINQFPNGKHNGSAPDPAGGCTTTVPSSINTTNAP